MYEKLGELKQGYTTITDMVNKHPNMLQDIGIFNLVEGEAEVLLDSGKETAILLLEGAVRLEWNGNFQKVKRDNLFEEDPWCLHIPKGVEPYPLFAII
ncbi:5-deoxy-glucuronate isomerase [Neobacillus ginsengisoli]|uniref:5-deoxy-D-glucuronate isomerase n=1 Tax=Neobacillus ginsengisoli TaxID=904295 RepID=A0ABT9XXH1_9BACI|nr:5-deoxy-glucuronate isomerase [Neobacillus ginsengisoli]MDQ0200271.1 5-deoxy-D-glucuronate isomerase [Neobacillus ginsengisoli]